MLRSLQLIAAIGVLVLFSLFTGVDDTTAWAMRILVCSSPQDVLGLVNFTQKYGVPRYLILFTASDHNHPLSLRHIPPLPRCGG